MKRGRVVPLDSLHGTLEAVRQIVRVRFAETLEGQASLAEGDDDAMHSFRLACKRLRYTLERFDDGALGLGRSVQTLERMTDELGAAHDCVVLAELAQAQGAQIVAARAMRDRDAHLRKARRVWQKAFSRDGPFEALAAYAGYEPRA